MQEKEPATAELSQRGAIPHVVVIGGGFGGLTVARSLSDAPVRVTLVDRSNHHLFQPLLYQVAMAGLSPADIAIPIRSVLHRYDNAQVLLAEAAGVDLDARELHLDHGGSLSWDFLVVACGAKTNYFGHDDWPEWALGLKSIDDALEIRRRTLLAFEAAEREPDPEARRRLLTFVIIGGGPTGVEVAGALSELSRFVLADDFTNVAPDDASVILLEGQDRLLPGAFHESVAAKAKRQLEELGVEVRLGAMVKDIDERGVHLADETIESTTVMWTAGVTARTFAGTLAEAAGVETDRGGRVVVEPDCSIPGHPEVMVIGDAACFIPDGARQPLPGIAPVALQQARLVAKNLERSLAGKDRKPFRYVDKGIMATVGRSRAVTQVGRLRLSGFVAWMAWLVIHIWFLIGFRNRVAVLLNWAWNYIMYKRGARLITGERQWDRLHELSSRAERTAEGED